MLQSLQRLNYPQPYHFKAIFMSWRKVFLEYKKKLNFKKSFSKKFKGFSCVVSEKLQEKVGN